MTRVLWLSRHALSDMQKIDLSSETGYDELTVDTVNMTYPARSGAAVDAIEAAAEGFDVVCGVFPAHIAAEIVRRQFVVGDGGPSFWVPVSMPVFAEDGTPRGFEHSHWERLGVE